MSPIKLLPKIAIGVGVTGVVGAVAFVAIPANAAAVVNATVVSSTKVEFKATKGKADNLTVTLSGRTVTFDNKVTVKAGKGCKAVKNDVTKVTCTTSADTAWVTVSLGDKNDSVRNQTGIGMSVWGGTGTDTITGGPKNDYLHGGDSFDRIWGSGGNDHIYGEGGGDSLDGGVGEDVIYGNAGDDLILGRDGVDVLFDGIGNDRLYGGGATDYLVASYTGTGADKDLLSGGADFDVVTYENRDVAVTADADGKTGDDGYKGEGDSIGTDVEGIVGGWGNDKLAGTSRDEAFNGYFGNDTVSGAGGDDLVLGEDGKDNLDGGSNFAAGGDVCDGEPGETVKNCEIAFDGLPPAPAEIAKASKTGEPSLNKQATALVALQKAQR